MNRLDRQEEAELIYAKYGWICVTCGESVYKYGTPQLAHKICKSKPNYKKYGKAVIDHPLNRVPTCSLYCNGKQNIAGNPAECIKLVKEINNE